MLPNKIYKIFILSFITLTGISLSGCSSGQQLTSNWADQQIKVDGDASDWQDKLTYLPDHNSAVGFRNDGQSLFICLKTNDQMKVIPMFRRGFTIWIEPDKDAGKTIGIKFPIFNALDREPGDDSEGPMFDREKPGAFIQKMIDGQKEIQIFNKDKFPLTLIPLDNNDGIEASLGYDSNSSFVYELQIPLENTSYQYKVAAAPGDKLNLSFETAEMNREGMGKRMGDGGGMRPPGSGGGGMGEGGGMRRGGGRRNPEMQGRGQLNFEPLNFEISLTLEKGK